ncbi:hypothetical protein NQT62_06275 [Limnobacter humi]|uniref:Cell division protein ZipA n=1 Tax=Limnobacter humi TaxID=1778671 RepID=A0ABT1WET8_9BURK|nr:hypothetical protein [Limnobacter humi]MCQ8896042.1 hypothetical protein [Limnobacter humi]
MNDLQLTLLIVGGGGIAAMIGYNWWQDFRLRKTASERFGESTEDPLLSVPASTVGRERAEPGFRTDESHADASGAYVEAVPDPILDNQPAEPLDPRLFVDFTFRFDEAQDANAWKALMDGLEQINRKKIVYAAGVQPPEGDEVLWFTASAFQGHAHQLKASIQIANRKGPLSSIEFSEVLTRFRRFAEDHNAEIEFPEMREVVRRAETLDQAAAALDTLLGLHCLMPEQVDDVTVATALVKAGWVQKGHQWSLSDSTGILATMVVHQAPGKRLLSFNIDVPNSSDPVRSLGDVVAVCHGFNAQYGAPMMDDSGRTLSTQAIEGIYNQLIERVRHLTDSGFKPGDVSSRILFS